MSGWKKSLLTDAQIDLILRICLRDRLQRRAAGFKRGTKGLPERLADRFGVSRETIRKIIANRKTRGTRYRHIDFRSIKNHERIRHDRATVRRRTE